MNDKFEGPLGPIWPEEERPKRYPHTEEDEEFNERIKEGREKFWGFPPSSNPQTETGEGQHFIEIPDPDTPESS